MMSQTKGINVTELSPTQSSLFGPKAPHSQLANRAEESIESSWYELWPPPRDRKIFLPASWHVLRSITKSLQCDFSWDGIPLTE